MVNPVPHVHLAKLGHSDAKINQIIVIFAYLEEMMAEDREIMRMYNSGAREQAFDMIVKDYKERLYWHLRRFVCTHEDADDLLQEVFIKVWNGLPGFRQDSRLVTWIWKIATNEALNFLRKKKIRFLLSMSSLEDNLVRKIEDDPYFNGNGLQRELWKSVQRLPEKQKAVFMMRYFDDMSYEDISGILDTSIGSLKASYHHACKKIKADLEKVF